MKEELVELGVRELRSRGEQPLLLGLGADPLAIQAAAIVGDGDEDFCAGVPGDQSDPADCRLAGRDSPVRILQAMVDHPVLVNRPIVVSRRGTRLCRPSERVFELLDRPPESFTKEDGEVVRPGR